MLGEKRELFLPSKQSYRKNPGISIVHNVAVKLFERAMTVPDATENILNMLSTFEDFSFSKMAETVGSQSFTVSQIVSFSKHSKCANAFRDVALDKLKKRVRPEFSIAITSNELCDVRTIDSAEDPLDATDFGGLTRISVDYDEEMLNQPIKDITQFKKHMKQILSNPIRIVKKRVQREVPYGVKQVVLNFCWITKILAWKRCDDIVPSQDTVFVKCVKKLKTSNTSRLTIFKGPPLIIGNHVLFPCV